MTSKSKTTKTQPSKKIVYTLSSVAKTLRMSPKVARAKFRRLTDDRPFDHTKVKTWTPVQAKQATDFLKADHRKVD